MPFITEELWHAIYDDEPPAKSIALSRYPQPLDEALDNAVEREMATLQDLIVNIRAARKELGVPEKELVQVRVRMAAATGFEGTLAIIQKLARVSALDSVEHLEGSGIRSTSAFDVQVVYERVIDVAVERERLKKELAQFEKEQANAERQLGNDGFLAKAPAHVVEGIRRRAAELVVLIEKTRKALDQLG
jgi:valyl-tRNA synthetase